MSSYTDHHPLSYIGDVNDRLLYHEELKLYIGYDPRSAITLKTPEVDVLKDVDSAYIRDFIYQRTRIIS